MRFIIKQKIMSLRDTYKIQDETGRDRYLVRRMVISLLKKYYLAEDGKLIAEIRKKVFAVLPQFIITLDDGTSAVVKKKLSLLGHRFSIKTDEGYYIIKGDIFGHEFEIIKDDKVLASVSKKWFAWSDTYGVDIFEVKYLILLLAVVLTIDIAIHERN